MYVLLHVCARSTPPTGYRSPHTLAPFDFPPFLSHESDFFFAVSLFFLHLFVVFLWLSLRSDFFSRVFFAKITDGRNIRTWARRTPRDLERVERGIG